MSYPINLTDLEPESGDMAQEVLEGLRAEAKTLPCKYFYDEGGSLLFDKITDLAEYYPTRTEVALLSGYKSEISEALGPECLVVEFGSGSGIKTQILLDELKSPAGYIPIDISKDHLMNAAEALVVRYPELQVLPVCGDFTQRMSLPLPTGEVKRRAVFFPGSTVGNFTRDEARAFLARCAAMCGEGGAMLIGVDLVKQQSVLEAAYNDCEGVTAAFNLNLLTHINRELGSNFDVSAFRHRAEFNHEQGRIEMYLYAQKDMSVEVAGETFTFSKGERVLTEYSHKYTLEGFASLAKEAGWNVNTVWQDPEQLFSVQYLER